MKKIFLAACILFATATVTCAQNSNSNDIKQVKMNGTETRKAIRKERRVENSNEVNGLTRQQFALDFPEAKNAEFKSTSNFDEVSFISGKKKLTAYYDNDNVLVGTTEIKDFTD